MVTHGDNFYTRDEASYHSQLSTASTFPTGRSPCNPRAFRRHLRTLHATAQPTSSPDPLQDTHRWKQVNRHARLAHTHTYAYAHTPAGGNDGVAATSPCTPQSILHQACTVVTDLLCLGRCASVEARATAVQGCGVWASEECLSGRDLRIHVGMAQSGRVSRTCSR